MDNHIRRLRTARQWTQADLAAELDVSRQTVNALETGKYDPSLPLAFRIARLFGRTIEEIFTDPDRPRESTAPAPPVKEPGYDHQTRVATALNELDILRELGEQGWELSGVELGELSFRRAASLPDAPPRWLYQRLSGALSVGQRNELLQQGWTPVDGSPGAVHYFKRPLP
ncbi:DNA-binding XRE family transcriptional regulator [Deinococcus humi]|uniref:DNA-binding XRE family transcriptional regulator n=1 Tax=Deinococcus humi TaxID=662880 RepID=A0A7W8JUR6_9DEIO|nr:DNA-binding XRE family transcriptional regulator [Deinococcus humi]GGO22570.1 hypothetical protein GCM10008949_09910 [Deinococcus humi]